jgi:hypothetical protein
MVLTGIAAVGPVGCSTMNNTEKGALIGGGVGSVAGTIVGAATGNPRTGAVVGALGGATLGGLAGNAEDKKERQVEQAVAAQQIADAQAARPEPLGLIGVVKMAQQGVNEDVIINHIRATGSTFQLSTADIEYLTTNNVPPRVIQAMQAAQPRYGAGPRPRTVVVREPAPVIIERPVYPVVYGPPPPPVFVGFSGRWR